MVDLANYFRELLMDVNMPLRLLPRPLTIAIMAREMPAAIRPYSIAVAPESFRQKLKTDFFILLPSIASPGPKGGSLL